MDTYLKYIRFEIHFKTICAASSSKTTFAIFVAELLRVKKTDAWSPISKVGSIRNYCFAFKIKLTRILESEY